jgi:hypothetical protein
MGVLWILQSDASTSAAIWRCTFLVSVPSYSAESRAAIFHLFSRTGGLMPQSQFVSTLLSLVFMTFLTCGARAQCDPANGHATLNLPAAGATVTAPIEVFAVVNASCRLTAIQVYVDGVVQWTQYRQTAVHLMLPATQGKHHLQVKGWNAAGTSFTADSVVFVSAVLADNCQSPFAFDNFVFPCKPLELASEDSAVWIAANVRSDTARLRETRITVNGQLWGRAFNGTATRPAAQFMLSPGLYAADIASSNTSGAEMHNGVNFIVRSQVACQPPVVSVLRPTADDGHPLGQPIGYFAAADGGRQCAVTSISVYVDGQPQYRAWAQSVISGRMWMAAGTHEVTVQAWNSHGQTGTRTLTVNAEESIEAFCVPGTTPGVTLCGGEPSRVGPVVGVGTSVDPPVPTTAARIYVNGVKRADYYGDALLRSFMLVSLPPGTFTFKAVAWNAAGEVSTDTQVYTFAP